MDISIIGAGGDVGRHGGKSAQSLYGLRADLLDAYAETSPEIDVAL